MNFRFRYAPWQEDEGAEIEMRPTLGILEITDMTQPEDFNAYMAGYYDYLYFMGGRLLEIKYVIELFEEIEEKLDANKEIDFSVSDYWIDEAKAWRIIINKDDTKFFDPSINVENDEHFQQTAIPTELFIALLKEWKKYLESDSQEEVIVDIPFAYDEALYRKTGKIQRKPS